VRLAVHTHHTTLLVHLLVPALRVFQRVHAPAHVSVILISASTPQEASRPKALQREEWMLVPPSSSDLLNSAPPFFLLNIPRPSRLCLLYA
jgi:hypothetical protein